MVFRVGERRLVGWMGWINDEEEGEGEEGEEGEEKKELDWIGFISKGLRIREMDREMGRVNSAIVHVNSNK